MEAADREKLSAAFLLRKEVYLFIASIFRKEPDLEAFAKMKIISGKIDSYVEFWATQEFIAGLREVNKYFADEYESAVTELQTEFARIFYGIDKSSAVYPYESVYLSPQRLLMQEPRDEVVECYAAYKLTLNSDFKEPEDHISCELYFMSYLYGMAAEALKSDSIGEVSHCTESAYNFICNHLIRWVESLSSDLEKCGCSFYSATGVILSQFIKEDKDFLDDFRKLFLNN